MNKITKIITNKYFITSFCFVAWIAYFDQNDWMTLHEREKELNTLNDNIAYLKKEIAQMSVETKSLTVDLYGRINNPGKLEKYAREQYRMKQENEDVYVIEH